MSPVPCLLIDQKCTFQGADDNNHSPSLLNTYRAIVLRVSYVPTHLITSSNAEQLTDQLSTQLGTVVKVVKDVGFKRSPVFNLVALC